MRSIAIADINWLAPVADFVDCAVKVRSTRAPVPPRVIVKDGTRAEVQIPGGENAVAPGQACVFYDGSRVLGGGWITKTEPASRAA